MREQLFEERVLAIAPERAAILAVTKERGGLERVFVERVTTAAAIDRFGERLGAGQLFGVELFVGHACSLAGWAPNNSSHSLRNALSARSKRTSKVPSL